MEKHYSPLGRIPTQALGNLWKATEKQTGDIASVRRAVGWSWKTSLKK